jgi:hypothetical protein
MRPVRQQERRARLVTRQLLATGAKATDPAAAARSVVALHATDPATVFLSIQARTTGVDVAAIESALYEERTLLRMLAMRRTMFVVPVEDAPILQRSSSDAIAVQQRKRYLQLLDGLGDGDWLDDVAESTVEALLKRGEATGAELSTDEPRLRSKVTMAEGKSYGGTQNITSWVLLLLAAQGRIVRGRPRGSWLSTQWRWSPIDRWLPGGMAAPSADDARAALVRRWLQSYGPGTVADLRWWTGWSAAHVKRALESVGAVEVDLDGAAGVDLPSAEPPTDPEPAAALLPALDPTPMGWSARDWYLGPHAPALFDRSGNIGPTVWWDGHVVGGWAQRPDGAVVHRLLEDVGRDAQQAIDAAAAALEAWIGPARVIPRFRTPLEKELTA